MKAGGVVADYYNLLQSIKAPPGVLLGCYLAGPPVLRIFAKS